MDHGHTFPLSAATSKVFENSAGNGKIVQMAIKFTFPKCMKIQDLGKVAQMGREVTVIMATRGRLH